MSDSNNVHELLSSYGIQDIFRQGPAGVRTSLTVRKASVEIHVEPVIVLGNLAPVDLQYSGPLELDVVVSGRASLMADPSSIFVEFKCPRCAVVHVRAPFVHSQNAHAEFPYELEVQLGLGHLRSQCDVCVRIVENIQRTISDHRSKILDLEVQIEKLKDEIHDRELLVSRVERVEHTEGVCEVCDRRRNPRLSAYLESVEGADRE